MHVLVADGDILFGIEDDDIGVRADGDGAFLRIEAEDLCRVGGDHFDESLARHAALADAFGIEHGHDGLQVRHAWLQSIDGSFFLLLLHRPADMVGRHGLQHVAVERLPQHVHLIRFAQRRPADIARRSDLGIKALAVEMEIDRTGFAVHRLPLGARVIELVHAFLAGEMHQIDRRIGDTGQSAGAVRRQPFGDAWA